MLQELIYFFRVTGNIKERFGTVCQYIYKIPIPYFQSSPDRYDPCFQRFFQNESISRVKKLPVPDSACNCQSCKIDIAFIQFSGYQIASA